jgi:hypothetical protein
MIRFFDKKIPYLTADNFAKLNRKAIRNKLNRQVNTSVVSLLGKDTKYPISMIVYESQCVIRCQIVLDDEGSTCWLDMSDKDFDKLPIFTI